MARALSRAARGVHCLQSRCLSRLSCDVGVAFDERQERAFVEYLAPQVLKWTLVGHVGVLCWNVISFIWNVVQMDIPWLNLESGAYDVGTNYAILTMISLGINVVAIAALIVAYFLSIRGAGCEIISILATTLSAIMLPWLDHWHGVTSCGDDPYVVWGPGTGRYEALRILFVVCGIQAYALYVPIRWRYCFIIPLCCTFSIIVLLCIVGIAGSSSEASTPFMLPLVTFLLFAPAARQKSQEVPVRERWLALNKVYAIDEEPHVSQAMSGVLCDVSFKFTNSFRFVGADEFRDVFFGREVEGTSILDLLSEEDGERLKSSADRMAVTRIPENLYLPLERESGSVEVRLSLVDAYGSPLDMTFLARLMISEEPVSMKVPTPETSTFATLPPSTSSSHPLFENDFGDFSDCSDLDGVVPQRREQRGDSRISRISDLSFTGSVSSHGNFIAASEPSRMLHGIGDFDGVGPQRLDRRHDSRRSSNPSLTYTASSIPDPARTLHGIGEFDGVVPQRLDRRQDSCTLSELSFALSVSSAGASATSHPRRILGGIAESKSRALVDVSTQTLDDDVIVASAPLVQSATTQEVAVNTTCVWRNEAFMCMTCAKPPKLPGLSPSLPARARRRWKKHQQQKQTQYDGHEFDGEWSVREEGAADVPDWLRLLIIDGAHVVFGDLTSTVIVMGESPGECLLQSGKIGLDDDGTLVRKGSSGRILRYDLCMLGGDEDCASEYSSCPEQSSTAS